MKKKTLILLFLFLFSFPLFVNASNYQSGLQAKVILSTETTTNGTPVAYLKNEYPKITVLEVEIGPGVQTGWHKHPVPVYGYVLSGVLTINMEDGSSFEFKSGDAIVEVVNTRHNGINNGKVPVKLVVFYTGARDVPNVISAEKP